MKVTPHFDIPDQLAEAIRTGQMVRRGGVVQWAEGTPLAGRVVAWLREVRHDTRAPSELGRTLAAEAGCALQMVGSVASIVNLGATVAFGIATLRKLGRMDAKLDALVDGQRGLQLTMDVGYRQMAESLENLINGQARIGAKLDEMFFAEVLSELRSAAADMETLQDLRPEDNRRAIRVEQVLGRVSKAYEALALDAEKRLQQLTVDFQSSTSGRAKLNITAEDVAALLRTRMACSASAQRARVLAEAGQPREAAQFLRQASARLRAAVHSTGKSIFQGECVYDDLLHWYWPTVNVTVRRVGVWAERFDVDVGSLEGVLDRLQQKAGERAAAAQPGPDLTSHLSVVNGKVVQVTWNKPNPSLPSVVGEILAHFLDESLVKQVVNSVAARSGSSLTAIDEAIDWPETSRENVPVFFDLLDGAWEDLDRLDGHAVEYEEMARRGLRVAAYGEKLRIEEVPDDASLVWFTEDEDDEPEAEAEVLSERCRVRVPGDP